MSFPSTSLDSYYSHPKCSSVSNYVARSGEHCALDAAVAISGGLDMRQMLNFRRSMRLWQPMLTFGLREDILLGKFARHIKRRLSDTQFLALLRTTHISALDDQAIVTYNGFEDLVHYYTEVSVLDYASLSCALL